MRFSNRTTTALTNNRQCTDVFFTGMSPSIFNTGFSGSFTFSNVVLENPTYGFYTDGNAASFVTTVCAGSDSNAGTTRLYVGSSNYVIAGHSIKINSGGPREETRVVSGFGSGYIDVTVALTYTHTTGQSDTVVQTDEVEEQINFVNMKVIDCSTAEAYWYEKFTVNIINPTVVGGSASNTNFNVSLDTRLLTATANTISFNVCFGVKVLVIDNSGNAVNGARVRIYQTSGALAKYVTPASLYTTNADYDFTTGIDGKVAEKYLYYDKYTMGGTSYGALSTASLSDHVTAGRLTKTAKHPFRIDVDGGTSGSSSTYFDMDEAKRLVISLGGTKVNGSPILLFGIRP